MNMDNIQGRLYRIAGTFEQAAGKVLGNPRMEVTGLTRKVLGHAQMAQGGLRERVQKRKLTPF